MFGRMYRIAIILALVSLQTFALTKAEAEKKIAQYEKKLQELVPRLEATTKAWNILKDYSNKVTPEWMVEEGAPYGQKCNFETALYAVTKHLDHSIMHTPYTPNYNNKEGGYLPRAVGSNDFHKIKLWNIRPNSTSSGSTTTYDYGIIHEDDQNCLAVLQAHLRALEVTDSLLKLDPKEYCKEKKYRNAMPNVLKTFKEYLLSIGDPYIAKEAYITIQREYCVHARDSINSMRSQLFNIFPEEHKGHIKLITTKPFHKIGDNTYEVLFYDTTVQIRDSSIYFKEFLYKKFIVQIDPKHKEAYFSSNTYYAGGEFLKTGESTQKNEIGTDAKVYKIKSSAAYVQSYNAFKSVMEFKTAFPKRQHYGHTTPQETYGQLYSLLTNKKLEDIGGTYPAGDPSSKRAAIFALTPGYLKGHVFKTNVNNYPMYRSDAKTQIKDKTTGEVLCSNTETVGGYYKYMLPVGDFTLEVDDQSFPISIPPYDTLFHDTVWFRYSPPEGSASNSSRNSSSSSSASNSSSQSNQSKSTAPPKKKKGSKAKKKLGRLKKFL